MAETTDAFIQAIEKSYTLSGDTIYIGAGLYNGAVQPQAAVRMPLKMLNRHGLVAGATGTGKTRTLQLLAEQLSDAGVPVFMLDVKGDLAGLSKAGTTNAKLQERVQQLGISYTPKGFPVNLYSLSGKTGAPMRATVLEFGPVLLSKVLELNDTQTGVLAAIFKYADDKGMPIVDLKDLKQLVSYLSEGQGAKEIKADYGSISSATAGTILRKIVALEQQGLGGVFGEPSFDVQDLMQKVDGKGMISLLNISDVQNQPVLYSTFLLSLLVELYNTQQEVGDLDKPKLVFFIDEAHLLFNDSSKAFLEQIESIIRLIRSKGIGIFFCTQSPTDVPESVLSQLGNRFQHALRTFTPNDADNLKKTVKTYPVSRFYDIGEMLTTLGTGQALVTVLGEKGSPTEVAAVMLTPPRASMDALTPAEMQQLAQNSEFYGKYATPVDSESAYEIITKRLQATTPVTPGAPETGTAPVRAEKAAVSKPEEGGFLSGILKSPLTRQIGREVVRGIFGMLKSSARSRR